MSGKEAGRFNNTKKSELGDKSTEQGWKSELARGEQEAWQNMLGARVEVKPLPDSVTPEVRRNLEQMGFNLRYVPALDLGSVSHIREKGVVSYLTELQRKYPKWKPFESLSDREKANHSVPRNLKKWFWEQVKIEAIDFPVLPGQWLAVETVEKPAYGIKYAQTPFAEKLGFRDGRFNVTWGKPKDAIDRQKKGILSEIGLARGADLRFLETLEWNLIGNREGWGKTNTYEWTNTRYRGSGDSGRLVVGYSDRGGAAYVGWVHPDFLRGYVGFRAALEFSFKD
jgi:hypothetical protein